MIPATRRHPGHDSAPAKRRGRAGCGTRRSRVTGWLRSPEATPGSPITDGSVHKEPGCYGSALEYDAARILVVEDDASLRRLLEMRLNPRRLRGVALPRTALRRWRCSRSGTPDVIVADVMMPRLSVALPCAAPSVEVQRLAAIPGGSCSLRGLRRRDRGCRRSRWHHVHEQAVRRRGAQLGGALVPRSATTAVTSVVSPRSERNPLIAA